MLFANPKALESELLILKGTGTGSDALFMAPKRDL